MTDPGCWLYRYFDARGNLLYVGITENFERRENAHAASPFIRYAADATLELFDTRRRAAEAEQHAIRTEEPLYNLAHVRNWERPERRRVLGMFLASVGEPEPYFLGNAYAPCYWCDLPRREHCYACRACACPNHEVPA